MLETLVDAALDDMFPLYAAAESGCGAVQNSANLDRNALTTLGHARHRNQGVSSGRCLSDAGSKG